MQFDLRSTIRATALAGVLAVLAGCGTTGPLEAPPRAAAPAGSASDPAPVQDDPFILDALL